MNLCSMLEAYSPINDQEASDQRIMLAALKTLNNPLSRNNAFAHFTASAWIVNADKTHVLMAYHNIYKAWSWTGGHADGESDLLAVALKEAREETGIEHICPVTDEIFSIEILPVQAHTKQGKFISPHLHLNVTFLLTADDGQEIRCKPDENSAVAWLPLCEAEKNREEPHMCIIYKKLNNKLADLSI